MSSMRRAGTTFNPYAASERLVTHGIFGRTRNPIYLGDTLAYGGVALLLDAGAVLVLLPVVLLVMHVGVIRREEAHLEARFGEAYRAYRARARRWL